MSWFKLDDKFHGNPKILMAGNAAVGLYVRCGTYCADQLTDGKVPKNLAKTYGNLSEIRALLKVGLWVETEDDYVMPDYLDFNPSRQAVLGEREAAKVRMARKRSGDVRANTTRTNARTSDAPSRPVLKTYVRSEQDAVWNALADEFGQPNTSTEKTNRGRQVRELLEVGATPDEIQRRIKEHARRRLNWKLTANALIKHWTDLEPKATDARKFDSYTGAYLSPFMSA